MQFKPPSNNIFQVYDTHQMTGINTIITTVISVFAIGATSCITDSGPDVHTSLSVGDPLPKFSTTLSDGTTVTDADLAGRCAVIVFFNTDCQDCRTELPRLQTAFECTRDRAEWLAIAREQSKDDVEAFWPANGLSMPYSAHDDRTTYNLFASEGIPRVYISANRVITAHYGPENMPATGDLAKTIIDITTPK